jgi:hypothetical protein
MSWHLDPVPLATALKVAALFGATGSETTYNVALYVASADPHGATAPVEVAYTGYARQATHLVLPTPGATDAQLKAAAAATVTFPAAPADYLVGGLALLRSSDASVFAWSDLTDSLGNSTPLTVPAGEALVLGSNTLAVVFTL